MLHEATAEGGLGFCGVVLGSLLPAPYHGPLVVALDSSILIDLQQHGSEIFDDVVDVNEPKYAEELNSLSDLLDLWLLRDIRLIVTPRSYTDAKRTTVRFTSRRGPTIRALAESLAFQYGDWTQPAPSEVEVTTGSQSVRGLPDSADKDLVAEAVAVGAHVFLTRDDVLIANVHVPESGPRVCLPSVLMRDLHDSNITHFSGGLCHEPPCPYAELSVPGPDLGKWAGLLAIFE
jgi:hypothetical protein